MRLARAHGDHGPYYVDTWEPIMAFRTQADADEYVKKIYDSCTPEQKFQVRLAFLGVLTQDAYDEYDVHDDPGPESKEPFPPFRGFARDVPGPSSGGAGETAAERQDRLRREYLLLNVMEYADSVHDCSVPRAKRAIEADGRGPESWKVPHRRRYIHKCVGSPMLPVVVERVRLTPAQRARMPADALARLTARRVQMEAEHVASWDTFLKFMTTNATLDFDGELVPNRLHGRDFVSGMFQFESGDFEHRFKLYLMRCIENHAYEATPEYVVFPGSKPLMHIGGSVYADILRSLLSTQTGAPMSKIDEVFAESAQRLDRDPSVIQGYCAHVEVWSDENRATSKEIIKLVQLADLCRNMRAVFGNEAKFMLDTDPLVVEMLFGIDLTYSSFARLFELDRADATTFLPHVTPDVRDAYSEEELFELAYAGYKRAVAVDWTRWHCDASHLDSRETKVDPQTRFSARDTGDVFHELSNVKVSLLRSRPDSFEYTITSEISEVDNTPPGTTVPRRAVLHKNVWYVDGEPIRYSANAVVDKIDSCIFRGKEVVEDPELRAAELMALKRAGDWGMVVHCRDNGMVFVTQDRFCALFAALMDVETLFLRVGEHAGVNQYSFALMTRETKRGARQTGGTRTTSPVAMACILTLAVSMAILGSIFTN